MSSSGERTNNVYSPMESGNCPLPSFTYRSRGKEVELPGNRRAYLVSTASLSPATCGIVLVHDIFGFEVSNTRRFADMLADQANAHVIIPNFFDDEPWPTDDFPPKKPDAFSAWFEKISSWERVVPVLADASAHLRTLLAEEHRNKLGILGFSWGGKQVLRACCNREYGFLAGVSVDGFMMESSEAEQLVVPVFFMPSGENIFMEKIKEILDKRPFGDRCRYFTFVDEGHGFASALGDLNNQSTLEAVNQAIMLASAFFIETLKEEDAKLAAAAAATAAEDSVSTGAANSSVTSKETF